MMRYFAMLLVVLGLGVATYVPGLADENKDTAASESPSVDVPTTEIQEAEIDSDSIFTRAMKGGWVVFLCLLILVLLSVFVWAIIVSKWMYLTNMQKANEGFIKSFWDSRSLNDLNSRLGDYGYSPAREVFRSGYSELVRGSQLRDQVSSQHLAVNAAMENMHRALNKAKTFEKRRLEKFISILAIASSAAPFIGLFGTVWGIMNAFESIAKTGSTSLEAVAPGISEALTATAFGLFAAIPAVIGYNIFVNRIRAILSSIDGFMADFLNIVERYLVVDRSKSSQSQQNNL